MRVSALGVWTHTADGPTTSFFAAIETTGILFDVGIDPIGRMGDLGLVPTSCSHVFLSHMHSDHSSGLSNFVFTRQLLGRELDSPLRTLTVMAAPEVLSDASELLRLQYPERQFDIAWQPLDARPFDLGEGLSATAIPVHHTIPTHGCLVRSANESIGFTADTAPNSLLSDAFASCDTLIGEAFGTREVVGDASRRGHLNAEDLGALALDARVGCVVPFHFGAEFKSADGREAFMAAVSSDGRIQVIDPVERPTFDTEVS